MTRDDSGFERSAPCYQANMGFTGRARPMKREIHGSPIDAGDYFTCCALGVHWYKHEELEELNELRRSTTVIGYLPIHLVVLLAIDAVEMTDKFQGGKEGINYG